MNKRIYIDTSVIGGCLDEEFSHWSNQLMREFRNGLKRAVISDLTLRELEKAPEGVKKVLLSIPEDSLEYVFLNSEAEQLARYYIEEKAVAAKHIVDAQHIAVATQAHVDVLVSWNFKQIVNLDRIHLFNAVNLKLGYPILEIRSPREVVDEKAI